MPALLLALVLGLQTPSVLSIPVETPKEIAIRIATAHRLNVEHFLEVIECESGWDEKAIGDKGTSFGLVQIHNPKRDWGITIEQAYDPEIALTLMAKAWRRGEERRWTCWRIYYD